MTGSARIEDAPGGTSDRAAPADGVVAAGRSAGHPLALPPTGIAGTVLAAAADLPDPAPGRIGPNAVTRLAEAFIATQGADACRRVFTAAGVVRLLDDPPRAMVDERIVARLHAALAADVGSAAAAAIAADAGRRTAAYLLAHRIPRWFQAILRLLPQRLARTLLLAAIERHAWTFAGSGRFDWRIEDGAVRFTVTGGALGGAGPQRAYVEGVMGDVIAACDRRR